MAPCTVNVIDILAEAKFPICACEAVITDVPIPTGVKVVPLTVAVFGLDEEKVHSPGDVDVGLVKVKFAMLSF